MCPGGVWTLPRDGPEVLRNRLERLEFPYGCFNDRERFGPRTVTSIGSRPVLATRSSDRRVCRVASGSSGHGARRVAGQHPSGCGHPGAPANAEIEAMSFIVALCHRPRMGRNHWVALLVGTTQGHSSGRAPGDGSSESEPGAQSKDLLPIEARKLRPAL